MRPWRLNYSDYRRLVSLSRPGEPTPAEEAAYLRFCQNHSPPPPPPLPASPTTISYFIAHLSLSYSAASIDTYLAAVRAYHVRLGHAFIPDPTPQLDLIIRGVKRIKGSHTRPQRLPITGSIMRQLKGALASSSYSPFDQLLYWTAFTLAFFGFLRIGELVPDCTNPAEPPLSLTDVQASEAELRLRIAGSKTDPFRRGNTSPLRHRGKHLPCPRRVALPGPSPNISANRCLSPPPIWRSPHPPPVH